MNRKENVIICEMTATVLPNIPSMRASVFLTIITSTRIGISMKIIMEKEEIRTVMEKEEIPKKAGNTAGALMKIYITGMTAAITMHSVPDPVAQTIIHDIPKIFTDITIHRTTAMDVMAEITT